MAGSKEATSSILSEDCSYVVFHGRFYLSWRILDLSWAKEVVMDVGKSGGEGGRMEETRLGLVKPSLRNEIDYVSI